MDAALKELTEQKGREFKEEGDKWQRKCKHSPGFRESSERFLEKVIFEEPLNGWIVLLIHLVVKRKEYSKLSEEQREKKDSKLGKHKVYMPGW